MLNFDLLSLLLYAGGGAAILLFIRLVVRTKTDAADLDREFRTADAQQTSVEIKDYNEEFFKAAQGQEDLALIRFFNPHKANMLRSLLSSGGVPNYMANETVSNILPGTGIQGSTDCTIYILRSDAPRGHQIAVDFLRSQGPGPRSHDLGQAKPLGLGTKGAELLYDPQTSEAVTHSPPKGQRPPGGQD
jgi:hypothetical protein